MTKLLTGKFCLVTGATSGIGRATVRVFTNHGATVFATGRNRLALEELRAINPKQIFIGEGDIRDTSFAESVVAKAAQEMNGFTSLVNCAGVLKGAAFGTEKCDLENFKENFETNTQAVFLMMVAAIPFLRKAPKEAFPSIVNVSSVNAQQSFGGVPSYCASKAAVDMLTKCAAVDLAPDGIRVNAVNPGVTITELQKRGGMGLEAYEQFLKRSIEITHPLGQALGRVATPEEVAELIAFLVSSKASFITGDCIRIDGGRACLGAR